MKRTTRSLCIKVLLLSLAVFGLLSVVVWLYANSSHLHIDRIENAGGIVKYGPKGGYFVEFEEGDRAVALAKSNMIHINAIALISDHANLTIREARISTEDVLALGANAKVLVILEDCLIAEHDRDLLLRDNRVAIVETDNRTEVISSP
jgi:hypothetical protein